MGAGPTPGAWLVNGRVYGDANMAQGKKMSLTARILIGMLIGAVLVAGARAPLLVPRELVARMDPGSVIVDVAVDQGGCVATTRPTTHADPVYRAEGVLHYGVANMPGAVPRTSAFALNNATLPFTLALAGKGPRQAMLDDPHLLNGLNVHRGKVTYQDVARDLGYDYVPAREALAV